MNQPKDHPVKVRILMITHNRPSYTQLSLSRLCETVGSRAGITIWDNGSSTETVEVLKRFEGHPAVERIIYNRTNDKLRAPTNWFWENSGDAEYLSKVDDDGLMPEGWLEKLEQAHHDIPQFGMLGTWRFLEEDFVPDEARKKIQTFGKHQLLRNCWVEGSGYLMKRAVVERIGLIRAKESFTTYGVRAAAAGFINGWHYPFLYQEHMDDPRAEHTAIRSEADFQKGRPLTAQTFKVQTREDWIRLNKHFARSLQTCSFNPGDYLGWKAWFLQKLHRVLKRPYVPRVS